jgi:hypothetical protein
MLLVPSQRERMGRGPSAEGEGLVAAGMEFGLLGPLAVRRDGVAITVPSGSQRILLAALLLKADPPGATG